MRTIERTKQAQRDYKRKSRGRYRASVDDNLGLVVVALAPIAPLEHRRRDHLLRGQWADHRACHFRPRVSLIYRELGVGALQLVRLGSHSALGLWLAVAAREYRRLLRSKSKRLKPRFKLVFPPPGQRGPPSAELAHRRGYSPSRVSDWIRPSRLPRLLDSDFSSTPGERLVITDLPMTWRPGFEPSADSVRRPQIV